MGFKVKRTVEVSPRIPRRRKRGGEHPRLWAFGYADLAQLLRTSEGAVRLLIHGGAFDPSELEQVVYYVIKRLYRSRYEPIP